MILTQISMKILLLILSLLAPNISLLSQEKCDCNKLIDRVHQFIKNSPEKVVLYHIPNTNRSSYREFYYDPDQNGKNHSRQINYQPIIRRGKHRFFFISSEKLNNDISVKIYKVNENNSDSLLYSIIDLADKIPSYIDVDLKTTGKYHFQIQFEENKRGCAIWTFGKVL